MHTRDYDLETIFILQLSFDRNEHFQIMTQCELRHKSALLCSDCLQIMLELKTSSLLALVNFHGNFWLSIFGMTSQRQLSLVWLKPYFMPLASYTSQRYSEFITTRTVPWERETLKERTCMAKWSRNKRSVEEYYTH